MEVIKSILLFFLGFALAGAGWVIFFYRILRRISRHEIQLGEKEHVARRYGRPG